METPSSERQPVDSRNEGRIQLPKWICDGHIAWYWIIVVVR